MPNCFQLFRKETGEGPVVLQTVDEEICKHFNVPCDPKRWYGEWYNWLGLAYACGQTPDDLVEEYKNRIAKCGEPEEWLEQGLKIAEWFRNNFTTTAFATRTK